MELHASAISRRCFALTVGGMLSSCVAVSGCGRPSDGRGRGATLRARPVATRTTWEAGPRGLGLGGRDAALYLPPHSGTEPLPLLVLLHGAGGDADRFLRRLLPTLEAAQLALLAPNSRGRTWDAVSPQHGSLIDLVTGDAYLAGFGPDVAFLDEALERVFEKVSIDPARIAIGGFSDGATYALSLGVVNGGLFTRVVAFSPGFVVGGVPVHRAERPAVFVSHGRADTVLPIDRTSGRIVPSLRAAGFEVTFREFDGGHEIPDAVVREAMAWLA